MNTRRKLILIAGALLALRWLVMRLPGKPGMNALRARMARNGILGKDKPVPAAWADAADPEPIFIPDRKTDRPKLVGLVAGTGPTRAFRKVVLSKHMLRRPPAICADVDSLRQAEQYGAIWFDGWDYQKRRLYRALLADFKHKGRFVEVDRGHGLQRGVLMTWVETIKGAATL